MKNFLLGFLTATVIVSCFKDLEFLEYLFIEK